MRQQRGLTVCLVAGMLAAVAIGGCHDQAATEPEVTGVQLAKGGSQDPEVTGTDPTGAPQDTTLDVEVSGSGFDDGSTVEMTLSGVPTEKVRTNSTRYRNPRTLIANITIAADAQVDFYDVEVTTFRGKKGIGTEMFEVTSTQTVIFTFRDGSDLIFGDTRITDTASRTTYTGGQCGVDAFLLGNIGNPTLRTKRYPIKQNEAAECGDNTEGRVFKVSFPPTGQPLDWDGQTMNAISLFVYYNVLTIPLDETEFRKVRIHFDDQGKHRGAGWGQACPWSLRFDPEWSKEAYDENVSEVQVTRTAAHPEDGYDEWKIEAGPEDVAVCLGGKNEPIVLGYYHLPFQMYVKKCEGEC